LGSGRSRRRRSVRSGRGRGRQPLTASTSAAASAGASAGGGGAAAAAGMHALPARFCAACPAVLHAACFERFRSSEAARRGRLANPTTSGCYGTGSRLYDAHAQHARPVFFIACWCSQNMGRAHHHAPCKNAHDEICLC
jgi:hypothetical protein